MNSGVKGDKFRFVAKRFIIFVIDGPGNPADPDEMKNIDSFNSGLRDRGQFVLAVGICGPDKSKVIDNRGEIGKLTNGSLFDEHDYYSGLWLIEAESESIAQELALDASKACNRRVELRSLLG